MIPDGVRVPDRWLLLAGCLAGGAVALAFGFSPDWDWFNYHVYDPHALLRGRLAQDVAPAQVQTFLNPLFHLPSYLAYLHFHPAGLVFLTGVIQGGQLMLLAGILLCFLPGGNIARWPVWAVAALGLCGPIFLSELGGTQGDTILSVLILAGLLLVLRNAGSIVSSPGGSGFFYSGIMLGLVTSLKLALAPYAISLGLAVLICPPPGMRWRAVWNYAWGGALGFMLGGAWFVYLWVQYESPVFPYFNEFFQSPWVGYETFRDTRFLPRSLVDWLAYPLVWLVDPKRVWEFPFRDIRVAALYVAIILAPAFGHFRAARLSPALRLALVFVAIAYLQWICVFSIYRYLAVIEMLAPLMLFALCVTWFPGRRSALMALLLLLASQLFTSYERQPVLWNLRADTSSFLPELPRNSMALIDGYAPLAYLAVWLPDEVPLVRTRANFMNTKEPESRIRIEAEKRVREHPGPVFLLTTSVEKGLDFLAGDLDRMGLKLAGPCRQVFSDEAVQQATGAEICKLDRVGD